MEDFSFYAVMESSSPVGVKHEILDMKENPNGTISRLRFRACMQDFGHRNRNGRLWTGRYMKELLNAPHILELLRKGFPGENGHPVPPTGQASMSRILTIDPNNISHKILNFQWQGEDRVYSDVETVCDIDGPGARFALNIAQGFEPAFSVRSIVPQRKNADGSIAVMPGGRVVTYDRVFLPSHEAAYRDESVDVKSVEKYNVQLIVNPSHVETINLLEKQQANSWHVFCGIRADAFVFKVLKMSLKYQLHRAMVTELPNTYDFVHNIQNAKPLCLHRIRFWQVLNRSAKI